jgi:hypothetical protein
MENAGLRLFISEEMLRLGASTTSQLKTRAGFPIPKTQSKLLKNI